MRAHQQRLGGAQATHHRTGIEVALHVAARRQGHRDGGKDNGQHRGDAEKTLRPFERAADFRARVIDVLDPLPRRELRLDLGAETLDLRRVAGHQQSMDDPAARADQAARREVIEADHDPRRNAEEIDAPVGLLGQDRTDDEGGAPNGQRIANPHAQRCRGTVFQPHATGRRNADSGFVGRKAALLGAAGLRRANAQGTAQRIAFAHRLDLGELNAPRRPITGAHHARERPGRGHAQSVPFGRSAQGVRPGAVGAQQQVSTEQLIGLPVERLTHPVGEEADRRQRRDGDHQRGGQETQLTGARIAAQHAPGKKQFVHAQGLPLSQCWRKPGRSARAA